MKHRIHKDSETTKQLGTNVRKKKIKNFQNIWESALPVCLVAFIH
jgi:hypothetical protein